jgi:hypothetical protein
VTDAQTDAVFDYFQSAPGYVAGDILTGVTIQLTINQTLTELSFSAPTSLSTPQTFTYAQETAVAVNQGLATGNGLFGADFTDLTDGSHPPDGVTNYTLYAVGSGSHSQTISPGETCTFLPGTPSCTGPDAPTTHTSGNGQYNYNSGLVSSVDPGFYATTGEFDLSYNTFGNFSASGGASNLNTAVRSTTTDTLTIDYAYTVPTTGTPEPSTMLLLGGAFVGLGLFGKKRVHKK